MTLEPSPSAYFITKTLAVGLPLLNVVLREGPVNHPELIGDVTDHIVNFYNAARLHSTLGNLSPIAFEDQSMSIQPIEWSEIT